MDRQGTPLQTMSKLPRIPMSPQELARQRSPEPTILPDRPEGFIGHCHWTVSMPAADRPKGSPRKVEYLGQAEWADSPMHSRLDAYYLQTRGRYWLLWIRSLDDNAWVPTWEWSLYGWALRKGVDREQAAVYLIMDAWREEARSGLGRFAWIGDAGMLSAVGMNAIADRVW
jgi:hypothetical protein